MVAVKKGTDCLQFQLLLAIVPLLAESYWRSIQFLPVSVSQSTSVFLTVKDSRAMLKLCKRSLHSNDSCLLSLTKGKGLCTEMPINRRGILFTQAQHRDFSGNSAVFSVGSSLIPLS